jgi:hypothetical protein
MKAVWHGEAAVTPAIVEHLERWSVSLREARDGAPA